VRVFKTTPARGHNRRSARRDSVRVKQRFDFPTEGLVRAAGFFEVGVAALAGSQGQRLSENLLRALDSLRHLFPIEILFATKAVACSV
jgi:hypothetical protein